jgi:tRNA(Ile)-lysidine synthase TilS/MesJ
MKTIIFLLLISFFNFGNNSNINYLKNVRHGQTLHSIESYFPNYHFKFYKKNEQLEISFAMLGYWEKAEGNVLWFMNDTLCEIILFKNLNEYTNFITNPEENFNIVIKEENLKL